MKELELLGHDILIKNNGDAIFKHYCPLEYDELKDIIENHAMSLDDIIGPGGSRSVPTKELATKFDQKGWAPERITISKRTGFKTPGIREYETYTTHEIDHFIHPGKIGIEIEWNNKDTFFDRDLAAFNTLHNQDVLNVGVIITRGTKLQALIGGSKYGASTTHWDKLDNKVGLGLSGSCPLICIGLSDTIVKN